MIERKHTPGPWESFLDEDWGRVVKCQRTPGSDIMCVIDTREVADDKSFEERDANAEFIVRACNAHYDLLEALEEYAGVEIDLTEASCHVGICSMEKCGRCSREIKARAAIAKAKKEESK
jgi:hypothetical protein